MRDHSRQNIDANNAIGLAPEGLTLPCLGQTADAKFCINILFTVIPHSVSSQAMRALLFNYRDTHTAMTLRLLTVEPITAIPNSTRRRFDIQ